MTDTLIGRTICCDAERGLRDCNESTDEAPCCSEYYCLKCGELFPMVWEDSDD